MPPRERAIHYTAYGWRQSRYACGGTYWGIDGTDDVKAVTCKRCRASQVYLEATGVVYCGNDDAHRRPVRAVARLSWPDGRFKPATGCASCTRWSLHISLDQGHPILVSPIQDGDTDA